MEVPKKKGGRPTKRPDIKTIVKLYETHTAKEIAEQYDVKEATVRSWVSRIRRGDIHE